MEHNNDNKQLAQVLLEMGMEYNVLRGECDNHKYFREELEKKVMELEGHVAKRTTIVFDRDKQLAEQRKVISDLQDARKLAEDEAHNTLELCREEVNSLQRNLEDRIGVFQELYGYAEEMAKKLGKPYQRKLRKHMIRP